MKSIFIFLFFVIVGNIFSQNKNDIKISKDKLEKSTSFKELIINLPSNFNIISAEYVFKSKGEIFQQASKGNEIPKSLKNLPLKSGDFIYLNLKLKEQGVKDPKLRSWVTKLIIE